MTSGGCWLRFREPGDGVLDAAPLGSVGDPLWALDALIWDVGEGGTRALGRVEETTRYGEKTRFRSMVSPLSNLVMHFGG